MVACRSWISYRFSTALYPNSSVLPTLTPFFTPPPANHIVKPKGLWSRPLDPWAKGVLPNSPPQTTKVVLKDRVDEDR